MRIIIAVCIAFLLGYGVNLGTGLHADANDAFYLQLMTHDIQDMTRTLSSIDGHLDSIEDGIKELNRRGSR